MNRGIYTTVSGMIGAQRWLDVVANNLANVSTVGFKRDALSFADTVERELRAAGGLGQSIGSIGAGADIDSQYTVMDEGPIESTGRPLDMAVEGPKGMFAVQTPNGLRYTRDGAFTLNAQSQIVDRAGNPVLDNRSLPITLPTGGEPVVSARGEIAVNGASVATLGIFDGAFMKEGENLYSSTNASAAEIAVRPRALEGSNVNAVASMIEMIQINRLYELAQRSVTQQDDLTQRLTQSLQNR
ncbi:MAG: flagellar hook-basal body protein [Fimbriimonas ginsengisoli]|uniref:Flagellar hook-basal body protein n=1 Tax=Fimbriimonas ginsengisoli TaxID=1005039 RepID=A0A931LVP6_FIMGI|nr:flagellar hook-basal body protein [Fimbriimonas ginsengisoli]